MNNVISFFGKITYGFVRFVAALLYAFGSGVYTALNGNEDYPLTQAMLPDLSDLLVSLNEAMDNAKNKDKEMQQIEKAARLSVVQVLRRIGASCTYESKGDYLKLLGTGFKLQKINEPSVLVPPVSFKLADGNGIGRLMFSLRGGKGIKTINFQLAVQPLNGSEPQWISISSNRRKQMFTGLVSGQMYIGRLVLTGARGQEYTTNIISRVSQ